MILVILYYICIMHSERCNASTIKYIVYTLYTLIHVHDQILPSEIGIVYMWVRAGFTLP